MDVPDDGAPGPGGDIPTGPEPDPSADPAVAGAERLVVFTTLPTVPVSSRYQVLGVLLAGPTALKGVPVQLQTRSATGWAPGRTVRTSATGAVSFTLTAGTAPADVRLVALAGARTTSPDLRVPVHAPVTIGAAPRYSATPGAAVPDVTGSSPGHVDGSVVAQYRPAGSAAAWTSSAARSRSTGTAKGGFTVPLRLAKGSWEVRLVRTATADLQSSTSKTIRVKVP